MENLKILDNIDLVAEWLNTAEEVLTPIDFQYQLDLVRMRIAKEVSVKFHKAGKKGCIDAATGVGKSYFAIQECINLIKIRPEAKIFLAVPTERLRDNNWKDEFRKWGALDIYNNNVERQCYASLHKIKGKTFSFIIADEYHHITEANSVFFKNNIYIGIMLLSATKPKNNGKLGLLERLGFRTIVNIPLRDAVKLKLVSQYKILVVETRLDDLRKNIEAGGEGKKFFVTEKQDYDFRDNKIKRLMWTKSVANKRIYQYLTRERMRLIYNLGSKKEIAHYLLDNFIPQNQKFLIFTGSIEHANDLCKYRYHSKNKKLNDKHLKMFEDGEIMRLSCVMALNEGVNIKDVDGELINQANSVDRDFIQRLGRLIRYRRNHVGKLILVCCIDTQDKEWTDTALESFEESTITRVAYSQILVGNFNYDDF